MSSAVSQRGSVFFYILIGIVLFALLGYAIANSLRGNSNISNERVKLTASEVVDTGNRLAEAAARLRLRGVARDEVSLENDIDTNYTNPNCLTDNCKIFSSAGGGLSWETPPPGLTIAPWFFTGDFAIDGNGSSRGDLIAFLPVIPLEVCQEINDLLGLGEPVPFIAGAYTADWFEGTYIDANITHPRLIGKRAGCVQLGSVTGSALGGATVPNAYHYYHVLLVN